MAKQSIFTEKYTSTLLREILSAKDASRYLRRNFSANKDYIVSNLHIEQPTPQEIQLQMPPEKNLSFYDCENSIRIHEAYKDLSLTQATDPNFWAYLSHITFWDYMRKRYPIERQPQDKQIEYITRHWFVRSLNSRKLFEHGIAFLWWTAHRTYDSTREDPYELTREFFTMQDYIRLILEQSIGHNETYTHAFLEYVVENPKLFNEQKNAKARLLNRRMNLEGGFKILCLLSKEELKQRFSNYHDEIVKARRENTAPSKVEE